MKLSELLEKGYLSPEDEIVWHQRKLKKVHRATINGDGSITTADGAKHRTPSGAAKHLNDNKPVDGWHAWHLKRTDESLSELRTQASAD